MIDVRTTIQRDTLGRHYPVIRGTGSAFEPIAYRLDHSTAGAPLEGRALEWCRAGECGWLMQDFVAACDELGLPPRYSGCISIYQAAHDPQPPTRPQRVSRIVWEGDKEMANG